MENKAIISLILLVWICSTFVKSQEGISFPDKNLENAVHVKIGKTSGEQIYKEDLRRIWSLDLSNNDIISIEGLQHCTKLYSLYLNNNNVSDISPLFNLTNLTGLYLTYNNIADISPIPNPVNLKFLYLGGN